MECRDRFVVFAVSCASISSVGCAGMLDGLPPFSPSYVKRQNVGVAPSWTSGVQTKAESQGEGGTSMAAGASFQYERRLSKHLYLQVPVETVAGAKVRSISVDVPRSYSSLFVTPGVQIRWPADWWMSWFVTGGAGLGRFVMSDHLLSGASNSAALTSQRVVGYVNLGIDVTIRPRWGIRADVRGHYAKPRFLSDALDTDGYPASFSIMPVFRF
jgi:hypothetical protein